MTKAELEEGKELERESTDGIMIRKHEVGRRTTYEPRGSRADRIGSWQTTIMTGEDDDIAKIKWNHDWRRTARDNEEEKKGEEDHDEEGKRGYKKEPPRKWKGFTIFSKHKLDPNSEAASRLLEVMNRDRTRPIRRTT